MSAPAPPTEAELDWLQAHAANHDIPCLSRACDEIRRLRALCKRAADEFPITGDNQGLRWELRAASKGQA